MKKIIVALTVAAAFLLAPVGDPYESAQAKGWCKDRNTTFCEKRKAKKAAQVSPGVFTREHVKKGMLYRGDQNVSVTVVQTQQSGGDRNRQGDRWKHGGWGRPGWGWRPHHDNTPDRLGPVIGGIGGFIVGRVTSPKPEVVVVQPQPIQVQNVVIQPWTVDWYNYCNAKYKSFDAKTGYYMGYDGRQHFCQ